MIFPLTVTAIIQFLLKAFQPPYVFFSCLTSAFLIFALYFFIKRFVLFYGQLKRKWNPPAPFEPRLLYYYRNAVIFWSFVLFFALLFVAFAFYLTSYQFLGPKVEVAGQVLREGSTVRFIDHEGKMKSATVKGPQTAAAGLFVPFPDWMGWIGLGTYHKLLTFRGNLENEYHYGKKPPSLFIEAYMSDRLLVFWYKNAHHLGFAEPAYIESVYFGGAKRRLLVTHSGYIVQ